MKTISQENGATSVLHAAVLWLALAPGLALAAPPQDGTVDTPPNASQRYYYLNPAASLPRVADKAHPGAVPPQGKPDKNNHLPVKPIPGPQVNAGHYRLTPLPF
ncbi:MAG: hypothetical protein ACM31P_08595 [Actinomycetota bacterium]